MGDDDHVTTGSEGSEDHMTTGSCGAYHLSTVVGPLLVDQTQELDIVNFRPVGRQRINSSS